MTLFSRCRPTEISLVIPGILFGMILFFYANCHASDELFPLYPQIEKNVSFWQDVYTRYTTVQGIIHDEDDLTLIYDVIELEPPTTENYGKINQERIDEAKEKFHDRLENLSKNCDPTQIESDPIAMLFGPNATCDDFRQAADNIRCQIGQKDHFLDGLTRSGAYLDQIQKIFESYNLPKDLAFLPHVESSFDIKAYSKFGAAGIWQFTLGTGRRFLKIDYTLDERRDPIAASHAAALLLKENFEKLNSWPLAITAYNHGARGMEKAKALWDAYPEIFEHYQSRSFKFASRNFYSEFLAARNVARSYERYLGKVNFDPPRRTYSMVLEGYASIDDILRIFNVDMDILAELNPAIRPPVYKGRKHLPQGYRLHLPITTSKHEDDLAAMFPRENYHSEQKPSHFYTVQKGDTAYRIARLHKVRLEDLLLANNLGRRATIYVDQNLRIPSRNEYNASTTKTPTPTSIAQLDIPKVPQPILATLLPIPLIEQKETPERGSTPSAAPALPSEKATLNPEIITGKLKIEKVWTEKEKIFGLVRVEVEETLGHFSDWLEIETQLLRNLNGLGFGRMVHIGQHMKIPLDRVSKEKFEEKRFDYHKRLQEDFFNAYQIEELQPYYVSKGENIWSLSNEKFNLPIWLIQQCNPAVDFQNLRYSQKLMIPVVEKRI